MYKLYEQNELLPEFEFTLTEIEKKLLPEINGTSRKNTEYIKWVQTSLNQILGLKLSADGIMGSLTRSAIRSFQKQNGLPDDGIVGSNTEKALKAILAGVPPVIEVPAPPPGKPMVDPKKVSCLTSKWKDSIFRKIGTNDPVKVLESISHRAVTLLDNTIAEFKSIKERVSAGENPGPPLIRVSLEWAMRNRLLMKVNDRITWTGKGRRNAGLIIRWFTNIRNTIAGGHLWFTCSCGNDCGLSGIKVSCDPGTRALAIPGKMRVYLCEEFWQPSIGPTPEENLGFQAQTLIHEVSHIYYDTLDEGMGPGRATCINQFIADANGVAIHPDFIDQCAGANPHLP